MDAQLDQAAVPGIGHVADLADADPAELRIDRVGPTQRRSTVVRGAVVHLALVSFVASDVAATRAGSSGVLAADEVGGLLGDHDDRRVDVAADEVGHHRGVDDAQAGDAMDPQLGIDHRHAVGCTPILQVPSG